MVFSVLLSLAVWVTRLTYWGTSIIHPSGGSEGICNAIARLGPEGGQIQLAAGTYHCSKPIIIRNNNIMLRGIGSATLLKLADGANCPVIVIGDDAPIPRHEVRGVYVCDLSIDGNREHQDYECWDGTCDTGQKTNLRSCGILLRNVTDAGIERVSLTRCRSAGIVTEKGCRRVTVRKLAASDNEFDGFAGYETEDSIFSELHLYNNRSAGLSTDIHFNRNLVSEAVIVNNGTQGIFMRDSHHNLLQGLLIFDRGRQGIFLAQDSDKPDTAAKGNSFVNLTIINSQGPAIRINNDSCNHNLFDGCRFDNNKGGALSESSSGLATLR